MNELPKLNNIIHSIEIDNDDKLLNEVRECIFILIDEFIENNIELYKYEDFEYLVNENVYDYFLELYPYDLLNIDMQYIISECIVCIMGFQMTYRMCSYNYYSLIHIYIIHT